MPNLSKTTTNAFSLTRKHHSTEAAEDYCELILDILNSNREARTCEIARHLGISHVTALRTINRLQNEGYLKTSQRKPITLTAKGKKIAVCAKERHILLVNFLIKLGVPRKIAEIDIEGAEHHFSLTTLKKIKVFMDKTII